MEVDVLLNTIYKVQEFVNIASKYDINIFIKSGKRSINAKSIIGIFGFDLRKKLTVYSDEYPQNEFIKFCGAIQKFIQ